MAASGNRDGTGHSLTPDDYAVLFGAHPTFEVELPVEQAARRLDIRSELRDGAVPRFTSSFPTGRESQRNPFVWAAVAGGAACVVLVGLLITLTQDEEPIIVEAPEEVIFPVVLSETEIAEDPVISPEVTSPDVTSAG